LSDGKDSTALARFGDCMGACDMIVEAPADVPGDFKAQKRSANPTIGAFEPGLGR